MKNWLTNATKKKIINEIKGVLYTHPKYRNDVNNVQNKFSFDERPQRGVIINGTSAERVRLSADNYMGTLSSFCMLTYFDQKPSYSIEWVKENNNELERLDPRRTKFPSQPGSYIITVDKLPDKARQVPGEFSVTPHYTVHGEPVIFFTSTSSTEGQISRDKIYPGSLRLWLDNRKQLIVNTDYTINYDTGEILFLKDVPIGYSVHADYRYEGFTTKSHYFDYEGTNISAIPGCVICFGDRIEICDKHIIVITDERTDVARIYGGKFEVSLELIAFSRDSEDREKFSDFIIHQLWDRQSSLGYEGIELIDLSPGGENEEVYNETDDSYFYESSISLSLRVDWETWIPLPAVVSRTELVSKSAEDEKGWLDGTLDLDLVKTSNLLNSQSLPVLIGKHLSFERII